MLIKTEGVFNAHPLGNICKFSSDPCRMDSANEVNLPAIKSDCEVIPLPTAGDKSPDIALLQSEAAHGIPVPRSRLHRSTPDA